MNTLFLSLILLLSLLIVGGLWWWQRRQRALYARTHLQETLASCRHLLALAAHLQQHRGMSSAWLSGDVSFEPRLLEKRRQIDTVFPLLMNSARIESQQPYPCLTANDVSLFRFRWQNLLEGLPRMAPETSMSQHGFMVAQVLEWLSSLGEARIDPLAGQHMPLGMIRNYAHRLPALTECLGQARAIGSSVAARHGCTPVARVRLMFLISRAEALLEQAAAAHNHGDSTLQTRLAVQEMARTVRTSMLLSHGVVVSPEQYFSIATRAIDAVYSWIGACSKEITERTAASELKFSGAVLAGGRGG